MLGGRLVIVRDAFIHHRGHRTFEALGLDLREQVVARRADFARKWHHDPAGRAYLALADGDLWTAAEFAEHALRERPQWPDGLAICARAALERGDPERARVLSQAYLQLCPFDSEAAIVLARAELDCGDIETGLNTFSHALATCWFGPERMAQVLCHIVDFWFGRQAPDRAWPFLEEALGILPDDGGVLNRLGVYYLQTDKSTSAIDAFRRAADAGDRQAALNLGLAMAHAGDNAGAVELWRALAASDDQELAERARAMLQSSTQSEANARSSDSSS